MVQLFDARGPIPGATVSLTIPARDGTRVTFGPPSATPDVDAREFHGPLTIRVTEPGRPGVASEGTVAVGLLPATGLVQVVAAQYEPPGVRPDGKSRLSFRLRTLGPVVGTPCPVELVLDPGRIPGLLSRGEGTFRGILRAEGDEVTLFAEDIKLDERGEEAGTVTLTVDGVPRALVFRTRFVRLGRATTPIPDLRAAVRVQGITPVLAAKTYPVTLEVDAAPDGSKLRLELGQYRDEGGGDRFEAAPPVELDASRGLVRLNPRGPDGALAFEATVREPAVPLDLSLIRGRRVLRTRLIDAQGHEEAVDELPLEIDDRAPESVRFVDPPKYGARGGSVPLRAAGALPMSGIREVVFYPGRPVDGQRPPGVVVVPGQPVDSSRTVWAVAFPLRDAKLGPVDLTSEFVAGVGLSQFATTNVEVVETIPTAPGEIRGIVREGERPQAGFEVVVRDEKSAEKGKTQTDDRGRFVVRGLPPGTYQVSSVKQTYPTRGSASAPVESGKVTEVEVQMFRGR